MNINPDLAAPHWDAIVAGLDGGYLDVYAGDKPATTLIPIGVQVLLATLRFSSPAFQATSTITGTAVANALSREDSAYATGTPSFCRGRALNGTTVVADFTAGVNSDTVEVNFVSSITQHNEVELPTFSAQLPP